MIGRGAIRNPWIFQQFRELRSGEAPFVPGGRDVLDYVQRLYDAVHLPGFKDAAHVTRMKKFMNYLGLGVEPSGRFLHEIRRAASTAEFFRVCTAFLDHDHPMPLEPFPLALREGDLLEGAH
jgi:tRNA-dihydrouridine synthase